MWIVLCTNKLVFLCVLRRDTLKPLIHSGDPARLGKARKSVSGPEGIVREKNRKTSGLIEREEGSLAFSPSRYSTG